MLGIKTVSMLGMSLICTTGLSSTAFADDGDKSLKEEVRTGAYDLLNTRTVTVDFQGSSDILSEDARGKIQSQLDALKGEFAIENVHVAVWGNQDFNSAQVLKGEVQDSEKELVNKRIENIRNALEGFAYGLDVEVYNMTETPNWFERTFNMDEAAVKMAMMGKAEPTEDINDVEDQKLKKLAQILKDEGGANKAVFVIETKSNSSLLN